LPALIRKTHEAKASGAQTLVVWGSGKPLREFLHVDDMADACVFLMEKGVSDGLINIGAGSDLTIRDLAALIMDVVGFKGTITFDASKPDGTPRKLMDSGKLNALGWQAKIALREGIASAYQDFLAKHAEPARG
jgi:GDP-L-fucose synthase